MLTCPCPTVRYWLPAQPVDATLALNLCWGFESQGLPWVLIEPQSDLVQVGLRETREICSSREILSQQAIGVLVAAALPRTAWIAEIDLHLGGHREALVVSHLLAAIPGQ